MISKQAQHNEIENNTLNIMKRLVKAELNKRKAYDIRQAVKLQKCAVFASEHGNNTWIIGSTLIIEIPWGNPENPNNRRHGSEYVSAKNAKQTRDVLGY